MVTQRIELTPPRLVHPGILADELGGYSLVIISCLGLAYCWQERGHIRITFLVSRMPVKVSNWLRVVTLTVALVYVVVVSKVSYDFIVDSYQRGIKSSSWLMTPFWWPQMAIPIGFTLLVLILMVDIFIAIRNMRTGVSTEAFAEEKAEEGAI